MLQGVKGPNLKQTRPAKFKLPVSYVDLESGEELQVPETLQRSNSVKLASLPAKVAKRRARLQTLKTVGAPHLINPLSVPLHSSDIRLRRRKLAQTMQWPQWL